MNAVSEQGLDGTARFVGVEMNNGVRAKVNHRAAEDGRCCPGAPRSAVTGRSSLPRITDPLAGQRIMLATPHLSILRSRAMRNAGANLSVMEGVVAPRVLDAMRRASDELTRLGVRHALVGGLAVGAHRVPSRDEGRRLSSRATRRLNTTSGGCVNDEAGHPDSDWRRSGRPALGSARRGSAWRCSRRPDRRRRTRRPIEALIHLKLKSPRLKDAADVIELLKAGIDRARCRGWLEANAPALESKFEELVERAERESD